MLVETDFHHFASHLLRQHGEGALTYALRNAQTLRSENSELGEMWMRVAQRIEYLVSTSIQDRQNPTA